MTVDIGFFTLAMTVMTVVTVCSMISQSKTPKKRAERQLKMICGSSYSNPFLHAADWLARRYVYRQSIGQSQMRVTGEAIFIVKPGKSNRKPFLAKFAL